MTSEPEDPRLSPEEEEFVRRALAASAGPTATPDHVTRRLDDVLADLAADRGDVAAPGAPPTRRRNSEQRHRRWPSVLVAAAVLSVIALGVGTLSRLGAGSSSESIAGSADAPAQADKAPAAAQDGAAGSAARTPTVSLHRDSLRADVRRVVALQREEDTFLQEGRLTGTKAKRSRHCAIPDSSRGDHVIGARLDGRPATLVLRKPAGGTIEAQVYSCGDAARVVVQTSVPAR